MSITFAAAAFLENPEKWEGGLCLCDYAMIGIELKESERGFRFDRLRGAHNDARIVRNELPIAVGMKILHQRAAIVGAVVEQGHVERARIGFGKSVFHLLDGQRDIRPVVQVVLGRAHEPAEHIGA